MARRQVSLSKSPGTDTAWLRTVGLCLAICAAGALAYCNSFGGVFLLDDFGHIVTSPTIQEIGPLSKHLSADRPLVHFSLAVNYAISGLGVWSYHLFNLLVHLAAGCALFGVLRRIAPASTHGSSTASPLNTKTAFVIALLWTVHPLQTQSVTYIIQRGESMMGLFYLLAVYGFLRGVQSGGRKWFVAAVGSCATGMFCKEAMVTAPFMVWLIDAAWVSRSATIPFRRRWGLYLGLGATVGLLATQGVFHDILFGSTKHGADIGFQVKGLTPWRYLLTQPEVILHYLRLGVWPYPLCFDYGWRVVVDWHQGVIPGLIVVALLAATIVFLWRNAAVGLLGAWVFVILAPTSSIVPIKDFAFEQRMYLPLAAVVTMAVMAAARFLNGPARQKARIGFTALAASGLCMMTVLRNNDYRSAVRMWADVTEQQPKHLRGWNYYGVSLAVGGDHEKAIRAYETALRLDPSYEDAHVNLAKSLSKLGRYSEAVDHFREGLKASPDDAVVRHSLAITLEKTGAIDEAVAEYRRAIKLQPDHRFARLNLGLALKGAGRWEEAITAFEEAARFNPADAEPWVGRANCMERQGRRDEAIRALEEALRIQPRHAVALRMKAELTGALR